MRNKKLMRAATLAFVSSLVIAGGAGTLKLTMAKTQQETITKEVASETESVEEGTEIGEGAIGENNQSDMEYGNSENATSEGCGVQEQEPEEKNDEKQSPKEEDSKKSKNKSSKDKSSSQNDNSTQSEEKVSYKNFDITFIHNGIEVKDGYMDITEALEKAIKYMKDQEGISIDGGKVTIQLTDQLGSLVTEIEVREVGDADTMAVYGDFEGDILERNYMITFDKKDVSILVDAVTGEFKGVVKPFDEDGEVPMKGEK